MSLDGQIFCDDERRSGVLRDSQLRLPVNLIGKLVHASRSA